MTIGDLMARYALADIRHRQSGLEYAQEPCACGHRRDEHDDFDGACRLPCDCIAFEED